MTQQIPLIDGQVQVTLFCGRPAVWPPATLTPKLAQPNERLAVDAGNLRSQRVLLSLPEANLLVAKDVRRVVRLREEVFFRNGLAWSDSRIRHFASKFFFSKSTRNKFILEGDRLI